MPQPTGQKGLDNLTPVLHTVFIYTATVFTDQRKNNPRAIANANAIIRVKIPILIDRFQWALDYLEVEIVRAKAVFRRDLEVLRKRAEETRLAAERETEENRIKMLTEERVRANQGQDEKETKENVGTV